jgi:outer membrane receptor protein involved in Fe transport
LPGRIRRPISFFKEQKLRFRRALLSLVLATVLPLAASVAISVPAAAQTPAGSINGTVSSDQGPLEGATISVGGSASRTVISRKDGTFTITGLPDGGYLVSIIRPGYAAVRDTAVTIAAGASQTFAVTLVAESLSSLRTIGTVTANGGRTSTALNTSAAAQSTVTFQQYIDRGQTQVNNLLEEQPGVEITRVDSGALGSNSNISLRGVNPYETQVLIDGHPVSGGTNGSYLIQFLNPLILSDVEIDKGPGANGNTVANAVGGSVNFRTPQIASKPTGIVLGGYDSFNGSTFGARFSDTVGKFGFLFGYAETGTPGYFHDNLLSVSGANANGIAFPGSKPLTATINTLIPSSQTYNNRSQLVKFAYNFSPTTTLTAGYYGSQSYVDYTGTLTTAEKYTIVGSCATCSSTGTTYTNPLYANYIGQTLLAANGNDGLFQGNTETNNEPIFTLDLRSAIGKGTFLARYYTGSIARDLNDPGEVTQIVGCFNPACNPAALDGEDFQQNQTDYLHGGDFEYDLPLGRSDVTLSYDTHDDISSNCSPVPTTCSVSNLIVSARTLSLRGHIAISPKLTFGLANYYSDTTYVGKRYDPKVTLTYQPSNKQVLRFAAGTAYVAPFAGFVGPATGKSGTLTGAAVVATSSTVKTLEIVNNLKPETSQSFDIGGDFSTGHDSKVTIDLFNTIVNNRFSTDSVTLAGGITGTFNGTPFNKISELFNQSDSHQQGIELGFIKAPIVGFGANAVFDLSHDYQFNTRLNPVLAGLPVLANQTGTFNNSGNILDGSEIPGEAYSKGHAELNYQFAGGARVAFGMTYYGAYNSFGQNAFELFDANFGIPLQHGFRLQVSGINIFNHDDGRVLGEFNQGPYTPIAAPGFTLSPVTLFFAPPRQVTLQLSHPL